MSKSNRGKKVFEWNEGENFRRIETDIAGRARSRDSAEIGSRLCINNSAITIDGSGLASSSMRAMDSGTIEKTVKRIGNGYKTISK